MKELTLKDHGKLGHVRMGVIGAVLVADEVDAQFVHRGAARANVRQTSRRTGRRVNRRPDAFYGGRYGGGYYAAPVAAGVPTAAVLTSLPGGCSPYNNYSIYNGTYYAPQIQGTEVVYIQVEGDD